MNRFREWSGDGGSDGGGAGAWIEEEVVIFETEDEDQSAEWSASLFLAIEHTMTHNNVHVPMKPLKMNQIYGIH